MTRDLVRPHTLDDEFGPGAVDTLDTLEVDPETQKVIIIEHTEEQPKKQYADFSFVIENMTYGQAEELMDIIIAAASMASYEIGGGFRMTTDADYPDEVEVTL